MATKRPHFVPRTYLSAWANAASQVAYRRRDGGAAIVTSVANVAVAGGIYGVGQLAQYREELFQQVEGEWVDLRRDLTQHGDLRGERRSLLAVFAALQLSRTLKHYEGHNFICNVAATTDDRPIPKAVVRQYISDLDGAEPDDNEVEAAWMFVNGTPGGEIPTPEMVFSVSMDVAVSKVAPHLEAMNWTVYKFGNPVLISSDCPVHPSRRASPEPQRGGIGIGSADEIRFPLSPSALLVMTRENRHDKRATAPNPRAINAEMFKHCHKFVIGTPQSRTAIDKHEMSTRSPRIRFDTGPGYRKAADGTEEYLGEVIHMYPE
ncbi:hypothetical protein MHAE_08503 [Mycobacterium haemophilum DSM 44634]|uniref:DUF4238 domain-containing protein n=1 Tax=Mycobacterium haemophilum TaxID=29311 RepID=UPI0006550721|nr:DUF4238 domain-containing protein [Mycobacterium haemophilum]AKN15684.1 hypothetical protein B586_02485 [Mycobacterium haemophilum DSM 44634]MCV7341232.1 DUF4238 domain-containing protein [Mycobacterium haemophilum DSM 44634]